MGDWVGGNQHGHGTYTHSNGTVYTGDWVDGKKHGQGKETFASGDTREGEWDNGIFQGMYVIRARRNVLDKIVEIENENECRGNGELSGNYSREQLKKLLPYTYVLRKKGSTIGFVTVLMLDRKEDMETFKACDLTLGSPEGAKASVMYIANIAVTKAERGKGYGAMMVEYVLKNNKHRMVRYTRPEMHSEHIVGKVCRKQGYGYVGHPVIEGRYGDDSDEKNPIAYRCILKAPSA